MKPSLSVEISQNYLKMAVMRPQAPSPEFTTEAISGLSDREISDLAHRMEDLLAELRAGASEVTTEVVDTLFKAFDWVIYIFGAFLVFTAVKLAVRKEEKIEPEKNPVLKLFKRYFRVTTEFHEDRFFFPHGGILSATPLFVVLLLIESSDLLFATDSVPAVLSITTDPFIVYTSNIFAILGLRSIFFVISGMMGIFRYLKTGISVVLAFVGVKMLLSRVFQIPVTVSLAIVFSIFAVSILASVIHKEKGVD